MPLRLEIHHTVHFDATFALQTNFYMLFQRICPKSTFTITDQPFLYLHTATNRSLTVHHFLTTCNHYFHFCYCIESMN